MAEEITLEITFKVGSLEEIGLGGFKQPWIDAERDGREFDLTCGAGVGNPYLEASARAGGDAVYARADISELAPKLWDALAGRLPGGAS
jgi:hypothetical protein